MATQADIEQYEREKPIRSLAPNIVIVVARGRSRLAGAEATADRESINSSVLVHDAGEWLIAAFQNARVPSAPASDAKGR